MLTCFKDIITLRGTCNDETSASNFFINDVGISQEELDSIVTKDYTSSLDFFEKKRDFAIRYIIQNIHNHFQDKYKANSVLRSGRIGFGKENLPIISGIAGTMKGIHVEVCNQSSFVDLFVSSISLQLNFTGNVDIKVYDLFENKLLDTIPISAIAEQIITVYPNKTYKSLRRESDIIFVYDTTGIDSIQTTTTVNGCTDCGGGGGSFNQLNSYTRARSVKVSITDTKIENNIDGSNDTGGMSLIYSLNCNHEEWLCAISNSLGMPILYKTAVEIMEFALHNSTRLNTETLLDADKIKERLDLYEFRFKESMENLMKNIKLPKDEKCFECRQMSKHEIILP